jgi:hypothetical protein
MRYSLTQERLKELLHYDPETGLFKWLVATSRRIHVGDIAGYARPDGYLFIKVDGFQYMAHRLIWLYVHDNWPVDQIDHINGLRSDNRLCNLREATNPENSQNVAPKKNNTSGFIGVTWLAHRNKWRAQIMVNRKNHYLGIYDTAEKANAARVAAKASKHQFNPVDRA